MLLLALVCIIAHRIKMGLLQALLLALVGLDVTYAFFGGPYISWETNRTLSRVVDTINTMCAGEQPGLLHFFVPKKY